MINSQSFQNDFNKARQGNPQDMLANLSSSWASVAPLAMGGLWFFRRFPKTTILGLAAIGAYIAYQKNVGGVKESWNAEDAHIH